MSVLYVKEQGSCIQKRSERIVVTKGQMTLLEIPLANVENIAIIGNVQITTQDFRKYTAYTVRFFRCCSSRHLQLPGSLFSV